MRVKGVPTFCVLFLTLLYFQTARVYSQEATASEDEENGLQFLRNDFEDPSLEQLISGKPLKGIVSRGQVILLVLSVPDREGLGFPDVILSLDVENAGADADLYCLPYMTSRRTAQFPSPTFATWKSQHTQGQDTIFLSRNQTLYDQSKNRKENEDGEEETVAEFICSIFGHSPTPADFIVTLDVEYTPRTLVKQEEKAIREIHDLCCDTVSACPGWRVASTEVQDFDSGVAVENEFVYDFCHMFNSFCDEDGHLTRLNMRLFGLDCEFPVKQFQKFEKLEKLLLSQNFIKGDIGEIGDGLKALPSLDQLDLRSNDINGSLAGRDAKGKVGICEVTKAGLEHLNLDNNLVEGPLPSCLFDKDSQLHDLYLDINPINSTIPDKFSEDTKLEILSISEAGIFGEFPSTLGLVPNLIQIDLRFNELEGSLPENIGNSPHLTTVGLDGNELVGTIPLSLLESPSLLRLSLRANAFTMLPEEWTRKEAEKSKLRRVDLSDNDLMGDFPTPFAFVQNLTILYLNGNQLDGELPDLEGMFPTGYIINLSDNEFTGPIPDEWESIGIFKGTTIFSLRGAGRIDLSNNMLTGPIPDFLLNGFIPFPLLNKGVQLGGNMLDCPEDFTADNSTVLPHIAGLEDCIEVFAAPPDMDFEGSPFEAPEPEMEENTLAPPAPAPAPAPEPEPEPAPPALSRASVAVEEPTPDTNSLSSGTSTSARELGPGATELLSGEQIREAEGSQSRSSSSSSPSTAAVAGIAAGVALIMVLAVIVALVVFKKRRNKAAGAAAIDGMELGAAKSVGFEKFHDDPNGARPIGIEGIGNR